MSSEYIIYLVTTYKYYILFPILVFEGPVATVVTGFLAAKPDSTFHIVPLFLFVIFADLFGDTMYYYIGRFGGRKIIIWLERRLSKKREMQNAGDKSYLAFLEKYFQKFGGRTIVFAKISHGLGWPAMVAAGSVKMNYKRFISFCAGTSVFKSFILLGIGYFFEEDYIYIFNTFKSYTLIFTVLIVGALLIYFKIRKRKFENKN